MVLRCITVYKFNLSLFSECLQNMEHNVIIIMRVREIRRIEEMKMQNVLREKPKWMLFILGG